MSRPALDALEATLFEELAALCDLMRDNPPSRDALGVRARRYRDRAAQCRKRLSDPGDEEGRE